MLTGPRPMDRTTTGQACYIFADRMETSTSPVQKTLVRIDLKGLIRDKSYEKMIELILIAII